MTEPEQTQRYTQCGKCETLMLYPDGEAALDQHADVIVLSLGVRGCPYCTIALAARRRALEQVRERLIALETEHFVFDEDIRTVVDELLK